MRNDNLEALSARGTELMHALHRDAGTKGYAAPDNPVTGALYPSGPEPREEMLNLLAQQVAASKR